MDTLLVPAGRSFQTKQAMAYHTLREAILGGQLMPGSRLVIDDIAKQLGLSAIPVREALQNLQSDRLVELRPHSGAIVTDITPTAVREIFALLEALEVAAFRLAVDRATAGDLDRLRRIVSTMEDATEDEAQWIALNREFHGEIPRIAQAPRIGEMLARISADWARLRHLSFRDAARPDQAEAHRQHRAMIAALAARDIPALVTLAERHNRDAMAEYIGT